MISANPAPEKGDAPPPDPEGKAAELLASEPAPRGRRGPKKGHGGRPKGSGAKPAPEPAEPLPITPEEIQGTAALCNVIWELCAVRLGGLTPLDAEEQYRLGSVAVPLMRKYASIFGGWEAELAFVVITGGLILTHMPPPEKKTTESFAREVR